MIRRFSVVLLAAGVALSACQAAPEELEPSTTFRLPMGFIPNVQFAPFYVADEKGYFREEGIELEFDYSFETDGVKLVGAGELPFSLVSGEQVLLARAQGLPVVYVMAWFQDFPIAIAASADSGINEPIDLAGRTVGIPGAFGASYVGLRALLHAAGLSEADISLEAIGFNQVESLVSGQHQAAVVYANNEPIQLNARGLPVNVLRVADYVQLASNGILTNERTVSEQPDLVRGMVRATLRGLEDTIEDPEAAFQIAINYVEGLGELTEEEQDLQRQVLAESIEFWKADQLGFSQPNAWDNMQTLLLDMGLLGEPQVLEAAYTNEFLP